MSVAEAEPKKTLSPWEKTRVFLEMIKISHTVFALPFAVGTAFLAASGWPDLAILGKIILAVFFARTAAMSFNRLADREVDAANPRTASRALPKGDLRPLTVGLAVIVTVVGFILTAAWINPLALKLSPVALGVVLGYSLTKRFTALCHFFLGLGLAIAPLGAWVAVRGELHWIPAAIGLAVLLWTAGFDILYACMDASFDRDRGLHSVPARLGVPRALELAKGLHLVMVGVLFGLGFTAQLGWVFLGACAVVSGLLFYEHAIVRPDDLTRVKRAFFTMNGVISVLLMIALIFTAFR